VLWPMSFMIVKASAPVTPQCQRRAGRNEARSRQGASEGPYWCSLVLMSGAGACRDHHGKLRPAYERIEGSGDSVCASKAVCGLHQTSQPSPSTVKRATAGFSHCRTFNTLPAPKRRLTPGRTSRLASSSHAVFTTLLVILKLPTLANPDRHPCCERPARPNRSCSRQAGGNRLFPAFRSSWPKPRPCKFQIGRPMRELVA
jgi:hypothetical protein